MTQASTHPALTSSLSPALATKKRVIVTALDTTSADRMEALFKHHYPQPVFRHDTWAQAAHQKGRIINLLVGPLRGGFETDDFIVVTEEDLFGEKVRSNPKRKTAEAVLLDTSVMDIGDYLVHEDHGIGKFEGLETVTVEGTRHDCVVVSYHGGDKLYVPAENSNVLSRYGDADTVVSLDRLGAAGWQNRKAKLKKRLRDMAEELLKIAAARALNTAPALIPDSDLYALFAARFPYAETDDQLSATA
jgi:transcription-repair coupling factor (superfamily II helicase)